MSQQNNTYAVGEFGNACGAGKKSKNLLESHKKPGPKRGLNLAKVSTHGDELGLDLRKVLAAKDRKEHKNQKSLHVLCGPLCSFVAKAFLKKGGDTNGADQHDHGPRHGFTLPQVLNTAGLVVNWMGTIPMIVIAISMGVAATALVIRWVRSSLPQG